MEVDRVDRAAWDEIVGSFDDGGFHQTWAYGAARWGAENLSHLVLRGADGRPEAAGQLSVLRVPVLRTGVAYLNWGPLWRRAGQAADPRVLGRMLAALREHYAERRGLLLRIMPRIWDDEAEALAPLLAQAGFRHRPGLPTYRTLLVDLSLPREELLARSTPKFRANLRKAEKHPLQVRVLEGRAGLEAFQALYGEMQQRKSFVDFSDIAHLEEIHAGLPPHLQLQFAVCHHEERPVAVQVTSLIGDTAVSLWAATNDEARRLRASHYLSFWLVGRLKEGGLRWYDLGGLEEEGEAGVNTYKTSLAGKRARDVRLIGKFDAWASPASLATVRAGDALRESWQRARLVKRLFSSSA